MEKKATEKFSTGQNFGLSGSSLSGFNLRVYGGTYSDLSEHSERAAMFGGFNLADYEIEKGNIYYIENFKCMCGGYRFHYGGGWACNNCQTCINTTDWWKVKVMKDGSAWCVVGENFENLQVSDNVGFGDTKDEALENYRKLFVNTK